jgi:hypothetical protein
LRLVEPDGPVKKANPCSFRIDEPQFVRVLPRPEHDGRKARERYFGRKACDRIPNPIATITNNRKNG